MIGDAGGGGVESEGGVVGTVKELGSMMGSMWERKTNEELRTTTGNRLPPTWVWDKDTAIDGVKLTEKEKGPSWWGNKYAKELAIADAKTVRKLENFAHDQSELLRLYDWVESLWYGKKPISAMSDEEIVEIGRQTYEREKQLKYGAQRDDDAYKNINFTRPIDAMTQVVQSNEPLLYTLQGNRNTIDCYGFDDFLDHPIGVVWLACKLGSTVGVASGGIRAAKIVSTEAVHLRAASLGLMGLVNTTVLMGIIKWGGNATMWASMFCAGDFAYTQFKHHILGDPSSSRSPGNFSAGLAASFGAAGILPWYFLNDKNMAVRATLVGVGLGGAVGAAVGFALQRTILLNLQRLACSNEQLETYKLLAAREKLRMRNTELQRREKRYLEEVAPSL